MTRGMAIAAFSPMVILLISWACISSVFCLAFLSVVARPVPRMGEQMAPRRELTLTQGVAVVLTNVKTASPPAEAALPSPCHAG